MVTPSPHGCGENFKGFLIDVNRAVEINTAETGNTPPRVGAMDFMAIGVLHGKPHRCGLNLESFFYVIIRLCANYKLKDGVTTAFPV